MYFVRVTDTSYVLIDDETNQYIKIHEKMILNEDHSRVLLRYSRKSPTLTFKRHESFFIAKLDIDLEERFNYLYENEVTEHLAIILLKKEIKNKYDSRKSI